MIYTREDSFLCFFHIPRCAGRWLNYVLYHNQYQLTSLNDHNDIVDGYEVMHLPKSYIDNLPENQFTFVRDPVKRFLSASGFHQMFDLYDLENMTADEFSRAVYNEMHYKPYKRQFLMPQVTFIDDDVKRLKVESGLSQSLCAWMQNNFNINISMPADAASKRPVYSESDTRSLSNQPTSSDVIRNIQTFYNADYAAFDYPKNL